MIIRNPSDWFDLLRGRVQPEALSSDQLRAALHYVDEAGGHSVEDEQVRQTIALIVSTLEARGESAE